MKRKLLTMDEHIKKYKLDGEERKLLEWFESGKWKTMARKDLENERSIAAEYAKNTIRKNKNINIRLGEEDINKIKLKALKVGIPYQTIVASILHRYANDEIEVRI